MKDKFANFIIVNGSYLPYLNVLLNSLDMYENTYDTYLLYYDFDQYKEYIESIQTSFNYRIIPIEVKRDLFKIHEFNIKNNNLFVKQARFKYIRELGINYDAICMFDADMFVVTKEFNNLYSLVKGTNKIITCNERYKWVFDKKYSFNNEPIFETPVKAYKFHCSVPIIFDLNQWTEVFDFYNKIAYNAFEISDGKILKPIGDIYCWNISVYKNNRQNDVIMFPMETMTQVHYTYNKLIKENNVWFTNAGDTVYSIHGRIGNSSWYNGQINQIIKNNPNNQLIINQAKYALKTVYETWWNLNFNYKLNLKRFIPNYERYEIT